MLMAKICEQILPPPVWICLDFKLLRCYFVRIPMRPLPVLESLACPVCVCIFFKLAFPVGLVILLGVEACVALCSPTALLHIRAPLEVYLREAATALGTSCGLGRACRVVGSCRSLCTLLLQLRITWLAHGSAASAVLGCDLRLNASSGLEALQRLQVRRSAAMVMVWWLRGVSPLSF